MESRGEEAVFRKSTVYVVISRGRKLVVQRSTLTSYDKKDTLDIILAPLSDPSGLPSSYTKIPTKNRLTKMKEGKRK